MQAVVIAAGEGERLKPYSDLFPKFMFPVKGKPIGRIIIERLVSFGLRRIILCVNNKWRGYIKDYFEDGTRFGISELLYSQSDKPLGTAGEVRNARRFIEDDFLVYYGDVLTNID